MSNVHVHVSFAKQFTTLYHVDWRRCRRTSTLTTRDQTPDTQCSEHDRATARGLVVMFRLWRNGTVVW